VFIYDGTGKTTLAAAQAADQSSVSLEAVADCVAGQARERPERDRELTVAAAMPSDKLWPALLEWGTAL